jgi:hypothetical protein
MTGMVIEMDTNKAYKLYAFDFYGTTKNVAALAGYGRDP